MTSTWGFAKMHFWAQSDGDPGWVPFAVMAAIMTVELKMPNYKDVDLAAGKVKEYLEKLEALTRA